MWLGPNLDIAVQRNAILPVGYQLIGNDDTSPLDITGYTLSCRVKYAAGSSVILATPTVTVVNALTGKFDILFDGRMFSAVDGLTEVVNLAYDVLATDTDGPICIMRGTLYLVPGVS